MTDSLKTKILRSFYLFLIGGFIAGILFAILDIWENEYIAYGTYYLALFSLWKHLVYYVIAAILCYVAFLVFEFLLLKILGYLKSKKIIIDQYIIYKILASFFISLAVTLIITSTLNNNSHEIIKFLKESPLQDTLSNFSKSIWHTFKIYRNSVTIFGIIFLLIFTYVPYRLGISAKLTKFIHKALNFRFTVHIALFFVLIFVSLNIYIFSFQKFHTPKGPNIVLISIDTLRADRLSSYGYSRKTSPNIDKLAAEGILFENAYSQAPWTLPAMATIHTSLYPTEHGATLGTIAIRNNILTLGEYMKNMNYKTMAITTHSFVDIHHGFGQGIDVFHQRINKGKGDITSQRIAEKAIRLLNENKEKKFFFWIHFFDPHSDYMDHVEYSYGKNPSENIPKSLSAKKLNNLSKKFDSNDIQYISDIYDEEISYTDKNVGIIIDEIEKLGLKDDTVVILTVDHGEQLHDRTRYGHGKDLYNELIHVPLIIFDPSEKELSGTRVENIVETRYIAKTIEEIFMTDKSFFGGINLINIAKDKNNASDYAAFSEGGTAFEDLSKNSVIKDDWKLIRTFKNDSYELYDLQNDPGEKENLFYSEDDPQVDVMRKELYSSLSNFKKTRKFELEKVKFSKEELKELKALGYME